MARLVLSLTVCASALRLDARNLPRRAVLCTGLAAAACSGPARARAAETEAWGPLSALSADELTERDMYSRDAGAGVLLPSGVRVIDLVEGTGRAPAKGDTVYAHYKVWAGGFREGTVKDFTFLEGRPYSWKLGEPTARLPAGADEGAAGMREGGWRRLVLPDGYGDAGLKRVNRSPGGGRWEGAKAGWALKPHTPAYFDLILVDGGSGRCDRLLRPEGLPAEEAAKRKSLFCVELAPAEYRFGKVVG